jgi:hypothetical protein
MAKFQKFSKWLTLLTLVVGLSACSTQPGSVSLGSGVANQAAAPTTLAGGSLALPSPDVWGGEARCTASACQWFGVEHETSHAVLYKFEGRKAVLTDRVKVAYHPDSARWLSDHLVVAAVETSKSLDVFSVSPEGKLSKLKQIDVGMQPRDVHVMPAQGGGWLMVATPYKGDEVAWIHWREGQEPVRHMQKWCGTPWHVSDVPAGKEGVAGLLTSCRDDRQVLYMPRPNSWAQVLALQPKVMYTFDHIPREVRSTPSGRYWYVAIELGGRVARYDTTTSQWTWMPFSDFGAVSVAPLSDDTVAWGENNRIIINRYDADGKVLSESVIKTSGFPTGLQWKDVDADGAPDLIVMNSAGVAVDIIYNPLKN